MEKQMKIKILTIVAMVVAILGLTIAFAALSQTLTINGSASVDAANWDIHFDNLSEAKITGKAEELNRPDVAEKGASITNINVSLNQPKDEVVYNVDLVNEGSINAEITNIVSPTFTEEQEKYLEFSVIYKNTGKELAIGDLLNANETKNLTITIRYSDDIDKDDLPDEVQNINISYEITYMQTDKEEVTTAPSEEEAYNVGDEFCIGEECFYVIKDNGDSVTALAKYNLNVNENRQSKSNASNLAFSDSAYWTDGYGSSSQADVYDENSNLYSYVENYESYLKSLGKTSVSGRLITYSELLDLCSKSSLASDQILNCSTTQSWLLSTSYWTGTLYRDGSLYVMYSGSIRDFSYQSMYGLRPVITIFKSDIS